MFLQLQSSFICFLPLYYGASNTEIPPAQFIHTMCRKALSVNWIKSTTTFQRSWQSVHATLMGSKLILHHPEDRVSEGVEYCFMITDRAIGGDVFIC